MCFSLPLKTNKKIQKVRSDHDSDGKGRRNKNKPGKRGEHRRHRQDILHLPDGGGERQDCFQEETEAEARKSEQQAERGGENK